MRARITDVRRASSHCLSAAKSPSGDSNRLKLEVGKFLNSVRAADARSRIRYAFGCVTGAAGGFCRRNRTRW
jgi:hypothetical protein